MSSDFNFKVFDKRQGRVTKTPQLTVQSGGGLSMNIAAFEAMGKPTAVELLYDAEQRVMGLRGTDEEAVHAYPIRPVGQGASTYVLSARGFFDYFEIPLGKAVRRVVRAEDGVLIVDLKDPGRVAVSNRNKAKLKAEAESPEVAAPE